MTTLQCTVEWKEGRVRVLHPVRGEIQVKCAEGCPQISRSLALELIQEIEDAKQGIKEKGMTFQGEVSWMKELIETHPMLKKLPKAIKDGLIVEPGEWRSLPGNRRLKKKLKRDGVVVHLYAGEEEGFSLTRSFQQNGGETWRLMEIDEKRGEDQDMMKPGGVYGGLMRVALEGKLEGLIGGPNCKTRSVLRHYPIEGVKNCPRPVRSWGGGEFGSPWITEREMEQVVRDDILLWRMIFLFMISNYVRKARGNPRPTWFSLEQPASPRSYMEEVVSFWDTEEWRSLKEEFELFETTFNQGELGGAAVKPTTFGGNLKLSPEDHKMKIQTSGREVRSSKELARWSPGVMNMISRALLEQVFEVEVSIKALSWDEHLANNHVPYRKDCLVCQETQQKGMPHRRVKQLTGGVLSLDTSGPLVLANDMGGFKAKYMLVGVLTWAVRKDIKELKEEVEEGPLEPDAPRIEDKEEEQPEEKEDEVLDEEEGREEHEPAPKEEEEVREGFEVRTFRMASPMTSKKAEEVTRTTMEFILKLRMDGYYVNRIHTDQGHEFMGYFKRWALQRGIAVTKTAENDPKANGRAEVAVQSLKTQVRRTLRQAQVGSEWWPWALRYVSEMNRCFRTGRKPDWPNFLQEVLVRKRNWRQGVMEVTVDKVKYLTPTQEDHGHWIVKEGESPRLTKYVMKKSIEPVTNATWLALERELADSLTIRRRLRNKTTIRSISGVVQDGEGDVNKAAKIRRVRLLEEEAELMIMDDPEAVASEAGILQRMKKAVTEEELEDEEVLQTKVMTNAEVLKDWEGWLEAIGAEVSSLLEEKEACREVRKEEVESMKRKAEEEGRRVELLPSKIVFTVKPGSGGGRKKVRWVVCGNYESKREQEDTFSGGADATAFRVALVAASKYGWQGATIDIKTAFLNAEMCHYEGEDDILVKAPAILTEKGYLSKEVYYQPLRAIYGLRRSPRLWSLCRDEKLQEMRIEDGEGRKKKRYKLEQLQSEPNLWKIIEDEREEALHQEDQEVAGLLMTYVDDLFIVSSGGLVEKVIKEIQRTWTTSAPERIGKKAVKFLGMDIKKIKEEGKEEEVWCISQESYLRDLLAKEGNEDLVKRKIPITKDQTTIEAEDEGKRTPEGIRKAQKEVGELLWVVTRSRPDIMYSVSRMGSNITRNPTKVSDIADQTKGYLKGREQEGLCYERKGEEEELLLECYSDSSFSPDGEESHGSYLILLEGTPIFWRSGRQALVTLSTAETELMEMVDGMSAGEAVFVLVKEVFKKVKKVLWSDSQSAISILTTEGGNWRTRHLKMRSSYARQAVMRGDWQVGHKAGEVMIADIGTKALASTRFEKLKEMMNMRKIEGEEVTEDAEKKGRSEVTEDAEKKGRREATEDAEKKGRSEAAEAEEKNEGRSETVAVAKLEEVATVIRLISLAAAISIAEGKEEHEKKEEEKPTELYIFLAVYTLIVATVMVCLPGIWKVGVRTWRSFSEGIKDLLWSRNHPGEPEEEPKGIEEDEENEGSTPLEDPRSEEVQELPSGSQEGSQEGNQEEVERESMQIPTTQRTEERSMTISEEWEEIEREEARIRREVRLGMPHVMGTNTQETDAPRELLDLPFTVFCTKYGKVYHTDRNCQHLKHSKCVSRITMVLGLQNSKWKQKPSTAERNSFVYG